VASRRILRLPTHRDAPHALKRQIFDAFELRILYDTTSRRIEISATMSDAARTLQHANDLPQEVVNVTQKDIAGAGFVARSDA
jgi:hypothetical protein